VGDAPTKSSQTVGPILIYSCITYYSFHRTSIPRNPCFGSKDEGPCNASRTGSGEAQLIEGTVRVCGAVQVTARSTELDRRRSLSVGPSGSIVGEWSRRTSSQWGGRVEVKVNVRDHLHIAPAASDAAATCLRHPQVRSRWRDRRQHGCMARLAQRTAECAAKLTSESSTAAAASGIACRERGELNVQLW